MGVVQPWYFTVVPSSSWMLSIFFACFLLFKFSSLWLKEQETAKKERRKPRLGRAFFGFLGFPYVAVGLLYAIEV